MTVEKLNRQRVVHMLDSFARGDIEVALACCTDDVDFLTHAPIDVLPHMVPRHGKEELRELWQTIWSRYSEVRYKAPVIVAEGDEVATYMHAYFRKRSNDRVVQFDMAVFYSFRGGLVAQIREIIDSYNLVQQVLEREIGPLIVTAGVDWARSRRGLRFHATRQNRENTGLCCKSHKMRAFVHCENVNCVLAETPYLFVHK